MIEQDKSTAKDVTTSSEKSSPPKRKSSIKRVQMLPVILLNILLTVSLITGWHFYTGKTIKIRQNAHRVKHDQIMGKIDNLRQELNSSNTAHQQKLDSQQQIINTSLENVERQVKLFQANPDQINDYLRIHEVKHLLNMANHHLVLANDHEHCAKILQQANSLLKIHKDSSSISLQGKTAALIKTLQSYPTIDKADIISQLQALAASISAIPLKSTLPAKSSHAQLASNSKENQFESWYDKLKENVQGLDKLIIVSHVNDPLQAVITNEQRLLIDDFLRSQLAHAQWAVLHDNQTIYHLSINNTKDWIQQHFDDKASETKEAIASLQKLDKIKLAIDESAKKKWQASLNVIMNDFRKAFIIQQPTTNTPQKKQATTEELS